MAAKKSKRSRAAARAKAGKIIYWILLLIFTAALAFAASFVLKDVDKWLRAYEGSQPGPTIEAYMNSLGSGVWDAQIAQLAASKAHPFQSAAECEELIRSELGSNLEYQRAGAGGASGTKYNIYSTADPAAGYYQIGTVTLKQDTSALGSIDIGVLDRLFDKSSLCPWVVSESLFDISAFGQTTSMDITCPASYTVMVNGHAVGPEYLAESGIQYDELKDYYAEHPNLPTKVRYLISNQIFGTLEPTFLDNEGRPVEFTAQQKEENFVTNGDLLTVTVNDMVRLPITEEEISELRFFADSFMPPYLNYFGTKNVSTNSGALKALIVPGCDIERRMTEFLDGAQWIHYYSLQINSTQFVDAFSLGDGFYVIDMDYDATAYSEYKTVQQASSLRIVVCRTDMGLRAITAE